MDRVARVVMLGCCVAALGGCWDGETTAPEATPAPSTTPATTTTIEASTTSAPTTTLSPRQHDEAEIREIHDRFFALMAATEPNPDNPEYAAVMTGLQLQRMIEAERVIAEAHQHFDGDVRGRLIDVQFTDAHHAKVRDCTISTARTLAADGHVVAADEPVALVTGMQLEQTSMGWRVADWLTGRGEPCGF